MQGTLLIAVLAFALQQAAPPASQSQTGTIRATVRVLSTGEPIAGALVTLVGAATAGGNSLITTSVAPSPSPQPPPGTIVNVVTSPPATTVLNAQLVGSIQTILGSGVAGQNSAITDANGIATFKDLTPGRYSVRAQRDGYMADVSASAAVVVTAPTSTLVSVDITTPELMRNIEISLVPAATISGVLTGSNGSPLGTALIRAGVLGYRDGRLTFLPGATAQANARGEYRLSPLAPGEYYIRVEPSPLQGFGAYYPGVTDIARAIALPIRGADEVVGIDFDFPTVPTFQVTGKVQNLPSAAAAAIGMTYVPADPNSPDPSTAPLVSNSRPNANGEFAISLPVGSWYIFPVIPISATLPAPAPALPRYVTGRARVDVINGNVEGVLIPISSVDLKGRIVVRDGVSSAAGQNSIRVTLQPRDNAPSPLISHIRSMQLLDSDSGFTFSAVPPGRYSLVFSGTSRGFHIAEMRQGTTSILNDGIINVGTDPIEPIEVTLSRDGGSIQGLIANFVPDQARTGRVVLVPAAERRGNGALYKSAPFARGTFNFVDVLPGEYKLFAWSNLPPGAGAEQNAEFIARYEDSGVPVSVVAGQVSNAQIRIIPSGR